MGVVELGRALQLCEQQAFAQLLVAMALLEQCLDGRTLPLFGPSFVELSIAHDREHEDQAQTDDRQDHRVFLGREARGHGLRFAGQAYTTAGEPRVGPSRARSRRTGLDASCAWLWLSRPAALDKLKPFVYDRRQLGRRISRDCAGPAPRWEGRQCRRAI